MKYILTFGLLISTASHALEPAMVKPDEDFNVGEVIVRLDEHMTNVETWYQTSKHCAKKTMRVKQFDMELLRSIVQVTHPIMIACFDAMEHEESLEPFFVLWSNFKREYMQSAQDQLLCKEIAFLVMHLYSSMLGSLQRTGTRVNVAQMLELYHIIAALPIYKLLALLDSIARQIITMLDQTYHDETSFFVWLWHNWWVPPTIISNTVSSLVDGITSIVTSEEPQEAGDADDDDKKSLSSCAL